ncbi:PGAP1-like protein [Desulforamulus aeronauticus DSM 10349]|uniref:PGAP1-like protein n=2 Tax=Desulforamulus aeronauticus TaxID=53343 RepID=A0A1M6SGB4_9FIRM|nr:PGAP1-like protein [Desulforamulus aeronauticus DSM 10349]
MKPLQRNLELLGYQCFLPDLPITYQEFEFAAFVLDRFLEEIVTFDLRENEKIHLVGHSTGGLVIRDLITKTKNIDKIGRCVLVASPNKGSQLANIAGKVKLYVEIFKTLKSLSYEYIEQIHFRNHPSIEIAAIAGDRSNYLLGNLIDGKNDGRVEVQSVYYADLKDFMIVPYGHKEIHHKVETAKYIDAFLRTGQFLPK